MKFITRDTDYAIRALVFMIRVSKKKPDRVITVDEIVEEEGLPERFLRRIFQRLAKKKILLSYKGKSGGFSFLAHPDKIRVADIVKIFQGDINFTNCLLKTNICPNIGTCMFRKRLKSVNEMVVRELVKIKISSLL